MVIISILLNGFILSFNDWCDEKHLRNGPQYIYIQYKKHSYITLQYTETSSVHHTVHS